MHDRREGHLDGAYTNEFVSRVDAEDIDQNFTFALHNERGADGKRIEGEAHWLKLRYGDRSVEGKFYSPQGAGNDTLLIFEPGMPGDAVGWMEEKHVPALLKAGYSVMAIRHMGTRTNTEKANTYVHCPERLEKGKEQNSGALGNGGEHDILAMADEPAIALNTLGKNFATIKLISHSAGTAYMVHALEKVDPSVREKITHLVSLSGHVGGRDTFTKTFPPLKTYLEYCQQHLNMGDADHNVEAFGKVFEDIYRRKIPDHIMVTQVASPRDEFFPPEASEKFHAFLGRGLRVVDETQSEPEFHDLKNFRPETLLRLLDLHHPKRMHTVTVKERHPKK